MLDARVGSIIMALITLMIMGTAATVLRGQTLQNVGDVAQQLQAVVRREGTSSVLPGAVFRRLFLVPDQLHDRRFHSVRRAGLGSRPTDLWPRLFTVAVLLVGMCVAFMSS